jgi:hypothetical protein
MIPPSRTGRGPAALRRFSMRKTMLLLAVAALGLVGAGLSGCASGSDGGGSASQTAACAFCRKTGMTCKECSTAGTPCDTCTKSAGCPDCTADKACPKCMEYMKTVLAK